MSVFQFKIISPEGDEVKDFSPEETFLSFQEAFDYLEKEFARELDLDLKKHNLLRTGTKVVRYQATVKVNSMCYGLEKIVEFPETNQKKVNIKDLNVGTHVTGRANLKALKKLK